MLKRAGRRQLFWEVWASLRKLLAAGELLQLENLCGHGDILWSQRFSGGNVIVPWFLSLKTRFGPLTFLFLDDGVRIGAPVLKKSTYMQACRSLHGIQLIRPRWHSTILFSALLNVRHPHASTFPKQILDARLATAPLPPLDSVGRLSGTAICFSSTSSPPYPP
jgi:hypothetical protein